MYDQVTTFYFRVIRTNANAVISAAFKLRMAVKVRLKCLITGIVPISINSGAFSYNLTKEGALMESDLMKTRHAISILQTQKELVNLSSMCRAFANIAPTCRTGRSWSKS